MFNINKTLLFFQMWINDVMWDKFIVNHLELYSTVCMCVELCWAQIRLHLVEYTVEYLISAVKETCS